MTTNYFRLASGRLTSLPLNWQERIESYKWETRYPQSMMVAEDGRVVGTWILGNNYKVASGFHGGYPATYLKRVAGLFPEKKKVLHLFSGEVDLSITPGDTVDLSLARALRHPKGGTHYTDDAQTLERVPLEKYDLVMADPPYSESDAEKYGTTMVKRNKVMKALARVRPGTHVAWLDMVLPIYRKDTWAIEAVIGLVRSTNHRFRLLTIFKRRDDDDL